MRQCTDDCILRMAGRYERVELIGSGTFGRALLVRRTSTGRRYVLKELKVGGLSERERGLAATEVRALAQCRHVNVIRYREAFLSDGGESGPLLCIVMEYAEAGRWSVDFSAATCIIILWLRGVAVTCRTCDQPPSRAFESGLSKWVLNVGCFCFFFKPENLKSYKF